MQSGKSALERAFELAESGECVDVAAIRNVLKREGYSDAQVTGGQLIGQLRAKIKAAAGLGQV